MAEPRHGDPLEDVEWLEFVTSRQHKGILYECQLCGTRVWSAFGNARRHGVYGEGCPARD